MARERIARQHGFTIIELIIALTASLIVLLGVAVVLVNSQESWHKSYNRAFSDIVTDSYVAGKKFKATIRQASQNGCVVDNKGNDIEVYYYSDEDSAAVNRYARFYELEGDLNFEFGKLDPRETLEVRTVCGNVSGCFFTTAGRSAQMVLTLDDGSREITTVSCAFMHN